LDLPDETCRLLVLVGYQVEQASRKNFCGQKIRRSSFERSHNYALYPGVGRCTRSDNDYRSYTYYGRRLVDFLLKNEIA
jgi:hypothetical protein